MSDSTVFSLANETALITGGGTGLGLGIAQCFIAADARVILVGRRVESLQQAVDQLGTSATYEIFDITYLDETSSFINKVKDKHGPISILVNNAGIHIKKPVLDTTDADFQAMLQTHVLGAFALTRAVLPQMLARKRGNILFMASMTSFIGMPNAVTYSAAKSAYLGMVHTLATELAPQGIRVNGIAPGWIESPMLHQAIDNDPPRKQKIMSRIAMDHFGQPEDIGWTAVYLCSQAAKYITGTIIPVDGGALHGFYELMKPLNRSTANHPQLYPEKVVQFGGGNFLRAFADWMVGKLNETTEFNGSVVVVKAAPKGMFTAAYDTLAAQEGIYHLVLTGMNDGVAQSTTTLESSINRVINPYHDFDTYLALAWQTEIRFIISNTTEAGITFDADNQFDDDPPANFPAKLTRFLYERYRYFDGDPARGCIIFPVELIEQNGANLLQCVLMYRELWGLESEFEVWLHSANLFCNTLVDRIVPGFPHDRAAVTQQQVGFDDALLVEGEQYHSWVIEAPSWVQDEFPVAQAGLNVKFVVDVTPYRDLKVRILNGAHTSMVPVGYLYGLRSVRETVEDTILGSYISDLLFDEVLPTLDASPKEREQMANDVLNRFRNPYLKHQLITISLNSTSKFRARVLPSLLAYADLYGEPPRRICLALAALIRFYKGEWQGEAIAVQDDPATMAWWQGIWQADLSNADRVANVLSAEAVWGQDLTAVPHLQSLVTHYLTLLEGAGMQAALEEIDG